jgi:hypothetical protein
LIGDVKRLRFGGHFDMERLGFLDYLNLGSSGSGFSRRCGRLRITAGAPFPALSACADGIAAIV